MVKCLNCSLVLDNCLCHKLDKYFNSNGYLLAAQDTGDNKMTYNLSKCLQAAFLAVSLAVGLTGCLQGPQGNPGASGARGLTGSAGLPGISGPSGPIGPEGQPAEACTTTAIVGGIRITCPDGSTQIVYNGDDGTVGPQGPKGDAGAAGQDGQNATPITMVQLCPDNGPTAYPASFPEFGECVGGYLYATYWTGSEAFTALIPPGQYASTSPQGCTFTVFAGCVVVQN